MLSTRVAIEYLDYKILKQYLIVSIKLLNIWYTPWPTPPKPLQAKPAPIILNSTIIFIRMFQLEQIYIICA
jgi:hypothetical protein